MQTSKNLRRPNNWQDFESLCKKLWGEIWKSLEIKKIVEMVKKNGVDVYGIPYSENEYYRIQCKDKYSNIQFDKKEIGEEIEKVKLFKIINSLSR